MAKLGTCAYSQPLGEFCTLPTGHDGRCNRYSLGGLEPLTPTAYCALLDELFASAIESSDEVRQNTAMYRCFEMYKLAYVKATDGVY